MALLTLCVALQAWCDRVLIAGRQAVRKRGIPAGVGDRVPAGARAESGQATVEYALVILAAAAIALLVVAWAARSGKIGELMDRVFDSVAGRVA